MEEIVYWMQIALLGLVLAVSVIIVAKGFMSGKRSLMDFGGELIWVWCGGGMLIILLELAENLVRLRHKSNDPQHMRRFPAKVANPSIPQMPRHCWVSGICDAVVLVL